MQSSASTCHYTAQQCWRPVLPADVPVCLCKRLFTSTPIRLLTLTLLTTQSGFLYVDVGDEAGISTCPFDMPSAVQVGVIPVAAASNAPSAYGSIISGQLPLVSGLSPVLHQLLGTVAKVVDGVLDTVNGLLGGQHSTLKPVTNVVSGLTDTTQNLLGSLTGGTTGSAGALDVKNLLGGLTGGLTGSSSGDLLQPVTGLVGGLTGSSTGGLLQPVTGHLGGVTGSSTGDLLQPVTGIVGGLTGSTTGSSGGLLGGLLG